MSFYFKERNFKPKPKCPKCDYDVQDMGDYLICEYHGKMEKPKPKDDEDLEDDLELINAGSYNAAFGMSGDVKKAYKSMSSYDINEYEESNVKGENHNSFKQAWEDDS